MNKQADPNSTLTEKLLDRIRKLYAMSQEVEASPHEAEIALRRCTALMERYGVTEDDLETSEFGTTTYSRTTRSISTHLKILSGAVGIFHDCIVVRNNKGLEFRGYEVDAQVALLTLEYLTDAMERCLSENKRTGAVCAGRSASHDFRMGFAMTLHGRIKSIVEARNKPASTGMALIVKKMAMVNQHCRAGTSSGKKLRVTTRRTEAYASGAKAGAAVSLNSQVGSSSKRAVLS